MNTNDYTMVSLATDLYLTINEDMPEQDVRTNVTIIPHLCNLMADPKIAQKGVYLGVEYGISLMLVDNQPHERFDFDLKFYEKVISKYGIPFVERHVALIKYKENVEIPHLDEIFDNCRMLDFIVD